MCVIAYADNHHLWCPRISCRPMYAGWRMIHIKYKMMFSIVKNLQVQRIQDGMR